jgi:ribosome biogenesis GTPase / thiamine phosphate phosphatase
MEDLSPTPHDAGPPRPPGWDPDWARRWRDAVGDGSVPAGTVPARVVRIDKGGIMAAARDGHGQLVVAAKSARRVAVGDVVALDPEAGRIEAILDRRTVFARRSPGVGRDEIRLESRAVAANMDLVLVLQPLDPGLNVGRLARELVLAWESGATPVVVLTKADLVEPAEADAQAAEARRWAPGAAVHTASTARDGGVDTLRAYTGPGHVLALLGASGAGKSSLANALAGREVQLVAEVRDNDRRGRHTTSAGQMIHLADGAQLIDTPGIRGVGLWAADDGLERAFEDLLPFAEQCRFVDCTHRAEPGCGILAAVEAGEVGADRLAVWHELVGELESLEADLEVRDREMERQVNQTARHRARDRGPVDE